MILYPRRMSKLSCFLLVVYFFMMIGVFSMVMVILLTPIGGPVDKTIMAERERIAVLLREMDKAHVTFSDLIEDLSEVNINDRPLQDVRAPIPKSGSDIVTNPSAGPSEPSPDITINPSVTNPQVTDGASLEDHDVVDKKINVDIEEDGDVGKGASTVSYTPTDYYVSSGGYQCVSSVDSSADGGRTCANNGYPDRSRKESRSEEESNVRYGYGDRALVVYQPTPTEKLQIAIDRLFRSILQSIWDAQFLFTDFPSVSELIEIGKQDISEQTSGVASLRGKSNDGRDGGGNHNSPHHANKAISGESDSHDYSDSYSDPIIKQREEMNTLREKLFAAAEKCLLVCKVLDGQDCIAQCGVGFEKVGSPSGENKETEDMSQKSWFHFTSLRLSEKFYNSNFYKYMESKLAMGDSDVVKLIITTYRSVVWAVIYVIEVIWYLLNLIAKLTTMKVSFYFKVASFCYEFVTVTAPNGVKHLCYYAIAVYNFLVFLFQLFVAVCRDILEVFK